MGLYTRFEVQMVWCILPVQSLPTILFVGVDKKNPEYPTHPDLLKQTSHKPMSNIFDKDMLLHPINGDKGQAFYIMVIIHSSWHQGIHGKEGVMSGVSGSLNTFGIIGVICRMLEVDFCRIVAVL